MIDSEKEADRVLCEKMTSTLQTVAKDVKIQVEFNPAQVKSYRLIGYSNRKLKNRDFTDDQKDAGDLGAGDTVTALYELILKDNDHGIPLKYQQKIEKEKLSDELLTVKIRYKNPDGGSSKEINRSLSLKDYGKADKDMIFATQVAAFGQYLVKNEAIGDYQIEDILDDLRACSSSSERREFVRLVKKVKEMTH